MYTYNYNLQLLIAFNISEKLSLFTSFVHTDVIILKLTDIFI